MIIENNGKVSLLFGLYAIELVDPFSLLGPRPCGAISYGIEVESGLFGLYVIELVDPSCLLAHAMPFAMESKWNQVCSVSMSSNW